MATSLTSFVAAPAGIAAVITLVLTLTRTSRLRKDEAVLRDSLKALDPKSMQHEVTASIHRSIMAHLVARHLTPQWRLAWPIGVLLAILAVNIQTGRFGADYIAENPTAGFKTVVTNATGDWFAALMGVPMAAFWFPFVWHSFVRTLVQRSEMALHYYQGKSIQVPLSLLEESRKLEFRRNVRAALAERSGRKDSDDTSTRRGWLDLAKSIWDGIGPGLFATCLGLMIGATSSGQDPLGSLRNWVGPLLLLLTLSLMLSFFSVMRARDEVQASALPGSHPAKFLSPESLENGV